MKLSMFDNLERLQFWFLLFPLLLFLMLLAQLAIADNDDVPPAMHAESPQWPHKSGYTILGDPLLNQQYSAEQIDTMLSSSDFLSKVRGVAILGMGNVVDTTSALKMLINVLQEEIKNPSSDAFSYKWLKPETEVIKNECSLAIFNLFLKGPKNKLYEYLDSTTGELHSRIVLILGWLGNMDVRGEVRNIYLSNADPYMRYNAIDVMNRVPDTLDIPILKQALEDDFYVEDRFGNKYWLIKGTAAGALINMGFTIERHGENYEKWVIVKEPEPGANHE